MKKITIKDIRKKSLSEIEKQISQNRNKLVSLRQDLYSSQVKNIRQIRQVRKDIARLLTIANEKKLEKEKE
ncbi:50S ribosomal protein L29 [Candidatus Saccharibacteria bacterium CPR2]|nr:50S ribosomal protein L29 [Candidatus Saccharibacteria bacterium CPR2]